MSLKLSPPRERLINCCLKRPHSTYELQSKIGAMNVPDHVMWLRKRGLSIPCELKPITNRDGKRIKSGEYSFTDDDKRKARELLGLAPTNPNTLSNKPTQPLNKNTEENHV